MGSRRLVVAPTFPMAAFAFKALVCACSSLSVNRSFFSALLSLLFDFTMACVVAKRVPGATIDSEDRG